MLAVFTVNVDFDENDGLEDNEISLRDAIFAATNAGPGNSVNFDSSLNAATIALDAALGEIAFDESLTIDASMLPNGITISGNDLTPEIRGDGIRVFNITDATNGTNPPLVTMIGLTLTGADPASDSHAGQGGAIRSAARLVLQDMDIRNNKAESGAGVFVIVGGAQPSGRDVLVIKEGSKIEQNSASQHGGGVSAHFSWSSNARDTVRIEASSVSGNTAGLNGGGLHINVGNYVFASGQQHAVIATSSQFNNNTAEEGGAIHHRGDAIRIDLSIAQSTITGNTATRNGGGLNSLSDQGSELRIQKTTVSNNTAQRHGGGLIVGLNPSTSPQETSSLAIQGSTISQNSAGIDGGGIHAQAYYESSSPFPSPRAITISQTVVSGNIALNRGGGMYTRTFGTETLIEETRVTNNRVPADSNVETVGNGGGIYAYLWDETNGLLKPRFTITGSTLDVNQAHNEGGGIFVCGKGAGTFIATNSTFSGNRTLNQDTGVGGGIRIARTLVTVTGTLDSFIRNSTVTANVSNSGGGVHSMDIAHTETRIANSIISQNRNHESAPNNKSNLHGRVVVDALKHNLLGTDSSILDHMTGIAATIPPANNNISSDAPGLEPLRSNGGRTDTHRLMTGSPAIDAGSNQLAKIPLSGPNPNPDSPGDDVPLTTDQRGEGFARVWDITTVTGHPAGPVDIGAYEIGLPKEVIQVAVWDTQLPAHNPFQFSTVVGDGDQLRSVPIGNVNSLLISFSEVVTVTGNPVTVQSARDPSVFYSGTVTTTATTLIRWTRTSGSSPQTS